VRCGEINDANTIRSLHRWDFKIKNGSILGQENSLIHYLNTFVRKDFIRYVIEVLNCIKKTSENACWRKMVQDENRFIIYYIIVGNFISRVYVSDLSLFTEEIRYPKNNRSKSKSMNKIYLILTRRKIQKLMQRWNRTEFFWSRSGEDKRIYDSLPAKVVTRSNLH